MHVHSEPQRQWCQKCQAQKEHWHQHGDPLESMTWMQLLVLSRELALRGKINLERVKVNGAVTWAPIKETP